jgi:squalene-hopene/tetraprenyl-beta-curcumene cyclase
VDAAAYRRAVDRAIQFLQTRQAPNGSFSGEKGLGVTSLVLTALLRHGRSPDEPLVAKGLKYLEGHVQSDGGIYVKDTFYKNYETCLALLAFVEANRDGRYQKLIKSADQFLRGEQWDEKKGHDKSSMYYGGAGYGKHKRPDLSNTAFLLDALKAAGAGPDDPNVQMALVFVSRCQELESEHNPTPVRTAEPNSGGFIYSPVGGGVSMAPPAPDGALRSYPSMTYAGLKSMIYAGVGPDDPRVKAAMKWIRKNYDLTANGVLGNQGLYYYYHTFAKALDASGLKEIEDEKGVKHDWRRELLAELLRRQRPDGSWINDSDRWMEDDPNLVTAYTLLCLVYCREAAQ